jgi:hypothetical protein
MGLTQTTQGILADLVTSSARYELSLMPLANLDRRLSSNSRLGKTDYRQLIEPVGAMVARGCFRGAHGLSQFPQIRQLCAEMLGNILDEIGIMLRAGHSLIHSPAEIGRQ